MNALLYTRASSPSHPSLRPSFLHRQHLSLKGSVHQSSVIWLFFITWVWDRDLFDTFRIDSVLLKHIKVLWSFNWLSCLIKLGAINPNSHRIQAACVNSGDFPRWSTAEQDQSRRVKMNLMARFLVRANSLEFWRHLSILEYFQLF